MSDNPKLFLVLAIVVYVPIYFAAKYWYVTLGIVVFALLLWGLAWVVMATGETSAEKARRRADIIERAESQHARLMDGDQSALYGEYPPPDGLK